MYLMAYDVAIRDFVFDAVLYVVKFVANFYNVQYEHIKRDLVGCVYVFFQIP